MNDVKKVFSSLTCLICIVSLALFVWSSQEADRIEKIEGPLVLSVGLTPVERALMFDYPQAMQSALDALLYYHVYSVKDLNKLPRDEQKVFYQGEDLFWEGLSSEMFTCRKPPILEKIREGEVWRFFTPSFLHRDFWHLLFNMGWLWILGWQIEERIGRGRFLILIAIVSFVSNAAQYIMTGPFFLGFSGVVAGFLGLIWSRQKKAPEENYPLPKSAALALFWFIGISAVLGGIEIALKKWAVMSISISIANTAHVSGLIAGYLLGKTSFFARSVP